MQNMTTNNSYKPADPAVSALGETLASDAADIRNDVKSLKDNVGALGQQLKAEACEKTSELKDLAAAKLETVIARGDESLKFLDNEVKANPRSAVAVAFAAGILVNFLLRR